MQVPSPRMYRCSKCSVDMTIQEFRSHDCSGLKVNRRTIRLPSRYG